MLHPTLSRFNILVLLVLSGPWLELSAGSKTASHISFEHIGLEQGLSQSTIKCILQDQTGFLWVGTDDGLNRYDGYSFKVFRQEPFKADTLSSSQIESLFEQRNGSFWVSTQRGLCRLADNGESFIRYPRNAAEPRELTLFPLTMLEDRHDNLWIYSRRRTFLIRLDPAGTFTRFFGRDDSPPITGVKADHSGIIWVATDGQGLQRLDPSSGEMKSFQHDEADPNSVASNSIGGKPGLEIDDFGFLWLNTQFGLDRFDPVSETCKHFHRNRGTTELHSEIYEMGMDPSGYIWLATLKGLIRFDPNLGHYETFFPDPDLPHSGPGSARGGLVSRDGGLWVVTQGQGLARFNRSINGFEYFRHDSTDPTSLGSDFLTMLYEDRSGTLWIGGVDSGLHKYSPAKQKFRHYLHANGTPKPISSPMVWSLLSDRDGTTWVGTARDGLLQLDPQREKIVNQFHSGARVRSLFQAPDGRIWYTATTPFPAIHSLDPKQGNPNFSLQFNALQLKGMPDGSGFLICAAGAGLYRYDYKDAHVHMLGNNNLGGVACATFLDDGQILTGGYTGLVLLNPKNNSERRFIYDAKRRNGLSLGNIIDLYLDPKGMVWIALSGGGLNRFDPKTESFKLYTTEQGLPNNFLYNILGDDEGYLWISTNNGLTRFSPETEIFRNYDIHDGLQSAEFNMGAAATARDGELLFGGVAGFNAFYPSEVRLTGSAPKVTVSAWIRQDQLLGANLASGSLLELEPGEPMLVFTYAGLDYVEPSKNTYAYELEGFDEDWQYVGARRRATYTNLAGGEYRMKIKAANSDGIWSEEPTVIRIRVKPRFYETSSFALSSALGLLCLLVLIYLRQRQRLHQRQEEALRWRDHMRKSEELEFARQLQLAMIPKKDIRLGSVEVMGQMITATEVGGDYFDFFHLDEKRLCVAYGDATGHGVAAGLVVGMVKLAATVWAMHPKRIEDMLADLNQGLRKTLPLKTMGMGFGLAVIDLERYEVEVCSSGMPYPFHFVAATGQILALQLKGPPLGYLKRISPASVRVRLAPGDRLIFLSDGFAERFDAQHRLWGNEATQESLRQACLTCDQPTKIASRLIEDCDRFAGARPCDDDMTIVVLQREPDAPQPHTAPAIKEAFANPT